MSEDEPYNAADEVQIKARTRKQKIKKLDDDKFIYEMMNSIKGRAWVWEELEECYILSEPVVPGDVYETYRNLGTQRRGKKLLMQAMEYPDLYVQMVKENKKEQGQ